MRKITVSRPKFRARLAFSLLIGAVSTAVLLIMACTDPFATKTKSGMGLTIHLNANSSFASKDLTLGGSNYLKAYLSGDKNYESEAVAGPTPDTTMVTSLSRGSLASPAPSPSATIEFPAVEFGTYTLKVEQWLPFDQQPIHYNFTKDILIYSGSSAVIIDADDVNAEIILARTTAPVSGTIVDSNGAPVAGLTVSALGPASVSTASDGSFSLNSYTGPVTISATNGTLAIVPQVRNIYDDSPVDLGTLVASGSSSTYTISFDTQGASSGPIAAMTGIALGATATLPAPTKTSYSFGGWWTGANGTGTLYTSLTPITSNVSLIANWLIMTSGVFADASSPMGMWSDGTSLYVALYNNSSNNLVKYNLSTKAGPTTVATVGSPTELLGLVGIGSTLYTAVNNTAVHVVPTIGPSSTVFSSAVIDPWAVATDGTYIYTGNRSGKVTRIKIDDSTVTWLTSSGWGAAGSAITFSGGAYGLALSPDKATLWIGSYSNNLIYKITANTGSGATTAYIGLGTGFKDSSTAEITFSGLSCLVADASYLYTCEATAKKVRKIELGGSHIVTTVRSGLGAPYFIYLFGSNLFTADFSSNKIYVDVNP